MKLSEIGITIGYVLVILGFFYFVGLALNTKEIVENFESKDKTVSPGKMAELIEDINTSMKDDLNIGKNRAAYQDALSQMHENVNLSMLKTLSDQKSAIPDDDELQRIQNLRQHRDTLSELEEFLDEVRD
jgi:phosphoribosylaminoimidazole carboxylase (NCAIR synthetase)